MSRIRPINHSLHKELKYSAVRVYNKWSKSDPNAILKDKNRVMIERLKLRRMK